MCWQDGGAHFFKHLLASGGVAFSFSLSLAHESAVKVPLGRTQKKTSSSLSIHCSSQRRQQKQQELP